MLETQREEIIQSLRADIAELEEKIKIKIKKEATEAAQVQARLFLEGIFAPYVDGVCQEWGVSPEEALRILIDDESTLGKIAMYNPGALAELVSQPEIRDMVALAKPLGNVSDEWIKEKMTVLLEVMWKIRPSMANAITTTPGGIEWFYDSLVGLRNIMFGEPQLNIEAL